MAGAEDEGVGPVLFGELGKRGEGVTGRRDEFGSDAVFGGQGLDGRSEFVGDLLCHLVGGGRDGAVIVGQGGDDEDGDDGAALAAGEP